MSLEYSTTWATILYDDKWLNILYQKANELCLQLAISPLHDSDVNDDGSLKKAHRHILFIFKSKKSRDQMYDLFLSLGCVGCEHIYNKELYYRYLYHDEQLDKAQYNEDDIIFVNCGRENFVNETTIFYSLMDLIKEDKITSFTEFYSKVNEYYYKDEKIIKVIRNNFAIFRQYIKDNYNSKFNERENNKNDKKC